MSSIVCPVCGVWFDGKYSEGAVPQHLCRDKRGEDIDQLRQQLATVTAERDAALARCLPEGWISVDDRCPSLGERVILFNNGVIQKEAFVLDAADTDDYSTEYFWFHENLDEWLKIESGQFWMAWPSVKPPHHTANTPVPTATAKAAA